MGDRSKEKASKVRKETTLDSKPIIRGKHVLFVFIRAPFNLLNLPRIAQPH
jgi:hypothetical protein